MGHSRSVEVAGQSRERRAENGQYKATNRHETHSYMSHDTEGETQHMRIPNARSWRGVSGEEAPRPAGRGLFYLQCRFSTDAAIGNRSARVRFGS
jgi:hypothetical protein